MTVRKGANDSSHFSPRSSADRIVARAKFEKDVRLKPDLRLISLAFRPDFLVRLAGDVEGLLGGLFLRRS